MEEHNNNISYSKIYKLLVHGEDDLRGHIAYSVYKQHKTEEITRLTIRYNRPPTSEELDWFMKNAESENQLRFYNERAVSILHNFLDETVTEQIDETRNKIMSEYIDETKLLRPKGFWYGVLQGVVASFIFVAGGILLLFATGGWTRIGQALIELAK